MGIAAAEAVTWGFVVVGILVAGAVWWLAEQLRRNRHDATIRIATAKAEILAEIHDLEERVRALEMRAPRR